MANNLPKDLEIQEQAGLVIGPIRRDVGQGAPVVKTTDVAGSEYVDITTGTKYIFNGTAWEDISSLNRNLSPGAGVSYAVSWSITVSVNADLLTGSAVTLAEIPGNTFVRDFFFLVSDGVGSTATVNIGTPNDATQWTLGNNDADGFAATLDIENPVGYFMSRLDNASLPGLGLTGALTTSAGGNIIITSAGDYSSSSFGAIATIELSTLNPAVLS